jgi:mRNA degradation ribonuclease J1/J2
MVGDPPKLGFVKRFHASGHLSQADLVKVIEFNPRQDYPNPHSTTRVVQ